MALQRRVVAQQVKFQISIFKLGEGFEVSKSGDARVGMIGFPSVGKSTLLTKLTGTFSKIAAYEFTTLTCIPGVLKHKGAKI
jgi:ribosome-interacting GTPase 1